MLKWGSGLHTLNVPKVGHLLKHAHLDCFQKMTLGMTDLGIQDVLLDPTLPVQVSKFKYKESMVKLRLAAYAKDLK